MHVLEDQQARHQPHRQGRVAIATLVNLAQAAIDEAPIDLVRQPHQRVPHIDDLFQRGPEQLPLTIIPRL